MTVEAHYVDGGLGSLVAEVVAERGPRLPRRAAAACATTPDGASGQPARTCTTRTGSPATALVATALERARHDAPAMTRPRSSRSSCPVHNQADHIGERRATSTSTALDRARTPLRARARRRTAAPTAPLEVCRALAASTPTSAVVHDRARRLGPRRPARARARRAATCSATRTRRARRRDDARAHARSTRARTRTSSSRRTARSATTGAGGSARCSTTSSAARCSTCRTGTSTARRRSSRARSTQLLDAHARRRPDRRRVQRHLPARGLSDDRGADLLDAPPRRARRPPTTAPPLRMYSGRSQLWRDAAERAR